MFAYLSCKGHTAHMTQTIAGNMHKSKEKTLSTLLKVATCCNTLI